MVFEVYRSSLELDEIEAIEGNRFLVALNEIDGDVLTATSPEREKKKPRLNSKHEREWNLIDFVSEWKKIDRGLAVWDFCYCATIVLCMRTTKRQNRISLFNIDHNVYNTTWLWYCEVRESLLTTENRLLVVHHPEQRWQSFLISVLLVFTAFTAFTFDLWRGTTIWSDWRTSSQCSEIILGICHGESVACRHKNHFTS